ncbi:hypothetical protein N9Y42_04100 [Mariniblastus sp.]|nr:hypothetical protein [Mariniblastus sp.]
MSDLSFFHFSGIAAGDSGEMGARLGESSYVIRLSESFVTEGCDCNHMSSDSVKLKFFDAS